MSMLNKEFEEMSMIVWRMLRWSGLTGSIALMAGCANLMDITSELEKKPPCCTTFNQLSYAALAVAEPTPIRLDSQSPVFEFDVGKSYFAALELPLDSSGRMLQLYSMATGSTAFETSTLAQIFCPRVLFLDADKRAIGAAEQMPLYDVFKGFGALRRGAGSQVRVPDAARYAVVHANPARFGQFVYRHDGASGYMVGQSYVYSSGNSISFPCAPVADVLARLQ